MPYSFISLIFQWHSTFRRFIATIFSQALIASSALLFLKIIAYCLISVTFSEKTVLNALSVLRFEVTLPTVC